MPNKVIQDTRSQRKLYQFWVDGSKPDLKPVIKQFNYWRNHRKLTNWILNMWRLWEDLSQDRLDVLFELFPQFIDKLHSNTELLDEVRGLRQDFKDIKFAPVQVQTVGLKPMSGVKELPMPTFNDEDTIVLVRDQTSNASAAFLESALNM